MSQQAKTSKGRRLGLAPLKIVIGVAAVALVGAGGYAFLVSGDSGGGTGARTSDIVAVSVMDFDITTTSSGELKAKNQIELRSELETRSSIVEVVAEGTYVDKGDLLVKLNADEIQQKIEEQTLKVEEERNELVAAENNYEIQISENDSKLRQAELKLDLAELALKQWRDGDVEITRQANALALEKAERDLARLREKCENNEELLKKQFISKDQYDQDDISLAEAEAALARAKLQQEIYETYTYPKDQKSKLSDVEEAKAELERVKRQNAIQLASKEAERVNERRTVAIHEQRLEKLEEQLEACTIRAPTNGLVVYGTSTRPSWYSNSEGPLQIGRQVHPNELLIVLPDTSEMIAEVRVPESLAGRVQTGQRAMITVDALGGAQFEGRVESKGVLAEQNGWRDPNTREYTVRIAIQNQGGGEKLKPSMRCEAEIFLGNVDDSLSVPVMALFRDGAVSYVHVPSGAKFRRLPVQVGNRSDTYVEILAGLEDGDRVLVREPAPAEVIQEAWDPEELRMAGFELDDKGEPRPTSGPQRGRKVAQSAPASDEAATTTLANSDPEEGEVGSSEAAEGEVAASDVVESGDAVGEASGEDAEPARDEGDEVRTEADAGSTESVTTAPAADLSSSDS